MELFKIGFITVRLVDIMDITIVSFLFYKLYEILRGSLAIRVIVAVISIFFLWKMVELLDFVLLKSILDEFLGLGAIALVIIFAPEIRRFLTAFSKNTLLDRILRQISAPSVGDVGYQQVIEALKDLRASGYGALIVWTGKDPLVEVLETGDQLNADISSRLIVSIFQKNSPLHDGAMVIASNKIASVRCILPISESPFLDAELGMRHRAAIGISEVSDALVLIVSEERRELSFAKGGHLTRNVDYGEVEQALEIHLGTVFNIRNTAE